MIKHSVLFCIVLLLSGCGPKAVKSPNWILGQPRFYPSSQYLIGVGSAPTAGSMAEAQKAAGISARSEIGQTIEVQIKSAQELSQENVRLEEHRSGQASWAMEVERSRLTVFTRTSTQQIVQGIELKEKYHDEKRQVLYVLAVLDKAEASMRLAREIRQLDEQVALLTEKGEVQRQKGDVLGAIKLYREVLNRGLKADVLRRQLSVVDPAQFRTAAAPYLSARLAVALTDLLRQFNFYVEVDGEDFVEDIMHRAMLNAGFEVQAQRLKEVPGLTLWGRVNIKWDSFPALDRTAGELQVCRAYLGVKIIDDRTGTIVGQVNLLANSNAEDKKQAQEWALWLLKERILEELPQATYEALSIEM